MNGSEDSRAPSDGANLIGQGSAAKQTPHTSWGCCRRIGKTTLLCGFESRYPMHAWVGPDWGCTLITYSLILVPFILIEVFILPSMHWALSIAPVILTVLVFAFFSLCACSDPGIIRGGRTYSDSIHCGQCDIERPPSAIHCYDCGVCIDELDHHCPWTGKCIGRRTVRYFYLFLISLGLQMVYSLIILILFFSDKFADD